MKKGRECAAILLALVIFLGLGFGLGQLLMPPRTEYGSLWDAYRQEPEESLDVLFFGSSLVYCSVVPACIREESGLKSFVLAGPEQTMPMTYAYIREACRSQSPQIVALDCTGMFFHRYEHYAKANIGYMPLGSNRLAATFRAAEPGEWPGLLFPLLTYHGRWREITIDDLKARLRPQTSETAGYTLLTDIAAEQAPAVWDAYTPEQADYARNLAYLAKIRDFCAEKGAELLLYVTPTASKLPETSLETLRSDAAALGISLTDFNESLPELGIDDSTDWYDSLHFNLRGAVKFSRWLGSRLAEDGKTTEDTEETAALWRQRTEYIHKKTEECS